jgi:excisionase family DNA binding protein
MDLHGTEVNTLLLRVEQAAKETALSRSTIYELIASGRIRAVKVGRATRIPRQALEEFVTSLDQND